MLDQRLWVTGYARLCLESSISFSSVTATVRNMYLLCFQVYTTTALRRTAKAQGHSGGLLVWDGEAYIYSSTVYSISMALTSFVEAHPIVAHHKI